MGTGYTRTNTADIQSGTVVKSAPLNAELNAVVNAFAASTGHSHDGTSAEGGPITSLLGNTLTFGAGTAGTDITITFDGETSDGVLKWMEDEDYFEFSDDILIATTEKIQFRDTAIFINSSADGQLDVDADTEVEITAPTVDINASTAVLISNDLKLDSDSAVLSFGSDNDTTLTHTDGTGLTLNSTNKLTFGDAASFVQQSSDGVLRIDGEATIDLNASTAVTVSNDLKLDSDAAVLGFGSDNDVTLTHVADTGLLLNSTMALQFNDASQFINAPSATVLDINATDEIELNATLVDINGNVDISGTLTVASNVEASGTYTGGGLMTTGGNIVIPDAGNIGSASDTNAIAISSAGVVTLSATTEASAIGTAALVVSGGLGVAKDVWIGDDLNLDSDAALLTFGADQDVTLTHVADTGILLNSTRQLQFGDSGTYIHQSADGVLDLVSDTEIEINATTIDINGNTDISGTLTVGSTYTGGGLMTTGGNIVIPNAGYIGSASDTDAIQIEADGDIVLSQDLAVTGNTTITGNLTVNGTTTTVATTNTIVSDTLIELGNGVSGTPSNDSGIVIERGSADNAFIGFDESEGKFLVGTGSFTGASTGNLTVTTGTLVANVEGNLTGTIQTAAQTNITSVGTLGNLQVDQINANASTITVTDSSDTGDKLEIAVGTHGATTITTTDDDGTNASIIVTADGTFEAVGTTITLDSGAGVNLETDALSVGNGGNTDVVVTFNANSADGVLTWMEDQDYFKFSDDILMDSTEKIQFGDTASFIHQSADGTLTIDGEVIIDLNASTRVDVSADIKVGGEVQTAKVAFTDGDDAITIADGGGITANTSLTLASGSTVTAIQNQNNMDANSTSALATQASIKAYVDSVASSANNVTGLNATGTELNTVADFSAVSVDTSTAIANNDAILMFDNGNNIGYRDVDLLVTYMESTIDSLSSLSTTGNLASGTIIAGFGAIDNGDSGIRTNTFTAETSIVPDASGGADIGSTSAEWGDVYIADDKYIQFGNDQNVLVGYDEDGDDSLEIRQNVEGAALAITFKADQGDDNADQWKLNFADGGTVTFQSKTSGSYATKQTLDTAGNFTVTGELDGASLDISGNADIAGDLTLSAGGDGALRFSAASSVKILDDSAASLVFEEADNAYMTFVTTDSSEAIKFDKALDINAAMDIDAAIQLDGTFTVGVNDTGYDVKFFGASASHFMLWDESADELVLALDSKLSFNDAAGGENIVASSDGHLEINAGTTLDITAPTVDINASTKVNIDGVVDITDTTDATDATGDTGALRTEGGASIAKKLYVGTDLNVTGEITASGGLNEDHNAGALSNSNATLTLDCHNGNNFSVTLAANITSFSVTNLPSSGTAFFFTLKVTQDSSARSITWGSAVKWAAGTAPTLSSGSGDVDVFTFYTIDGGTTIYAFTAGQALA